MATGAAVAGTGMKAYAQYKQAENEAEFLEGQAEATEAEATEIFRRAAINMQATKREGKAVEAKQISGFVSAGVEITEGTPLTVLEDTNEKIVRQLTYDMQATQFTVEQKRRQAQFAREKAAETRKAGKIAAAGTLISGSAALG